LSTARQNAKLLATAKSALTDISHDLGTDAPQELKGLPAQEDQPKVDAQLGNLNLPADAAIDLEAADALAAARESLVISGAGEGTRTS